MPSSIRRSIAKVTGSMTSAMAVLGTRPHPRGLAVLDRMSRRHDPESSGRTWNDHTLSHGLSGGC